MKKIVSVAFCVLMLCSLLLIANMGIAMAFESGYLLAEAYTTVVVTVDGKWTSADEWTDAWLTGIYGANARWAYKMNIVGTAYPMSWLLESPDSTNDPGDKWQICIDGAADGGTAPNSNDVKFEIAGHTTLTMSIGTGTGWGSATPAGVTWKDSLTTTPGNAANHYVLELQFDKTTQGWGGSPPPHGVYVAMYDASNPSQGWIAWPPTSPDNPSRWGDIATYDASVPEGFGFGLVMLLSTVVVLVGSFSFRNRIGKFTP